MTQPAKGQEPSMEEILASIRRIIADEPPKPRQNDRPRSESARSEAARIPDGRGDGLTSRTPQNERLGRGAPAPERPVARRFADEGAEHVHMQREQAADLMWPRTSDEPPAEPAVRPPAPRPASEPAMQQEDIDAFLAELGGESSEDAPTPQEGAEQHAEDLPPPELTPSDYLSEPDLDEDTAEQPQESAPEGRLQLPRQAVSARPQPDFRDDPRHATWAPAREQLDETIISANTTAAVNSAFNTLAQTVLVQNGRTLEDLVREMLRPMLKTWLDDNLPGMVERLVRAEIERVSRGRG